MLKRHHAEDNQDRDSIEKQNRQRRLDRPHSSTTATQKSSSCVLSLRACPPTAAKQAAGNPWLHTNHHRVLSHAATGKPALAGTELAPLWPIDADADAAALLPLSAPNSISPMSEQIMYVACVARARGEGEVFCLLRLPYIHHQPLSPTPRTMPPP